ncbi:MAG: hypothetical protein ACXWTK_03325 [Methylobacter sp.]
MLKPARNFSQCRLEARPPHQPALINAAGGFLSENPIASIHDDPIFNPGSRGHPLQKNCQQGVGDEKKI